MPTAHTTVESQIAHAIADDIAARPAQVQTAIALLDEGATVPFIARYRKEATGGLDDTQLRLLEERLVYLRDMEQRRSTVIASIRSQDKLTDDLEARLLAASTKAAIEDLYLPYRPKRRTRAQIARERGLQALAESLLADRQQDPERAAQAYLGEEVPDTRAALEGARDILTERFAEDAQLLGRLRSYLRERAVLRSRVREGQEAAGSKFADYFDYAEPWVRVAGHRALALLRGRNEAVLTLDVEVDADAQGLLKPVERMIADANHIVGDATPAEIWLLNVVRWAWRVKLSIGLAADLMVELKTRAEAEAIDVFARNLKDLLLAAPAGARPTLGLDPGIRTGVKVAAIDATGKLLETATVYPFQPRNDMRGTSATLLRLIAAHGIELIAVGNGTHGRETERLVAELLPTLPEPRPQVLVVSEAGASVYSASARAAAEFPDLDVSLRGAVSIARRVQDPLAELVKIEPRSIGVGQYQHDVDQNRLARSLDVVVEDAVNAVGVDLNTASAPLLARVAGLSDTLAENIITHRDQHGAFRDRRHLLKVARLGPRAFEQCAGFLRIREGEHPLDATAVHPEAYVVAARIVSACGRDVRALMGDSAALRAVDPVRFVDERFGLPTVRDILAELEKPGRDPRPEFRTASFAEGVREMADLQPDMVLEGVVTNVAAFGAFVDIGVHQDGLVHVSQLADRFVRDPREVVKAGQIVSVRVVSVDSERRRIALSMRQHPAAQAAPRAESRGASRPERAPSPAHRPKATAVRGTPAKPSPAPGSLGAALVDALKSKR